MKKTPWFSKTVKPIRVGWYEVKGCPGYFDCGGMHWWDGAGWKFFASPNYMLGVDPLPWRGILE